MEVTRSRGIYAALLPAILIASASTGCRKSKSSDKSVKPAVLAAGTAGVQTPQTHARTTVNALSVLAMLPECTIDHDGLMIDLGVPSRTPSRGYGLKSRAPIQSGPTIDRAGSSFLVVAERRFRQDFWLDEPTDGISLRARVAGRSATAISLWLDGRRLGRNKLQHNAISVVTFPRFQDRLEAGRHTLTLQAHGKGGTGQDPWFEIDWFQLRRGTDEFADDAAPTLRDIVADQEIDNIPRRSIVLRAASTIRCPFHLSGQSQLNLSLGFWGVGRGTAEIRIVEETQAPTTLLERKVAGGNGARWTPVTLDLSKYAGRVVALELRALSASQGGRIVFGEPQISRLTQSQRAPNRAKTVVVVVASGLERRLVPPWGPIANRSAFVELRREAAAFDGYRVPTTVPAGVMASLLTGVSPTVHKVEDTAARLDHSIRTISEVIKQAGGRTAMFTGVPTTFAALGFNVSWDEYGSYSPVLDLPADTPITEASRWLARELDANSESVRFVLVHARGAHPPWDLSKEQASQLEPLDYGGPLDARRGGITLGRMRRQVTKKGQRRLNDEDLVRLRSLMDAAFSQQVAAVGQLVETLKRRNAWDDTLFIFAGDTTNGDTSFIPFDPLGNLREEQLSVPLLVKFPQHPYGGTSFSEMVTTMDLTRTILDAVGLKATEPIEGINLLDAIVGQTSPQARTLVATLGQRYVSRTGVWRLSGEEERPPKLCQTDVDPMCVEDRFGQQPLTARSLWQWTSAELAYLRSQGQGTSRQPASIDPETAAALVVWGDVEM